MSENISVFSAENWADETDARWRTLYLSNPILPNLYIDGYRLVNNTIIRTAVKLLVVVGLVVFDFIFSSF